MISCISAYSQDVFSIISDSEEHSTFVELLELTGLDALLRSDDYYSVFAPSNETFEKIYTTEELDSLMANELEYLELLVMHHIVPDSVYLDNFSGPFLPLFGSYINLFVDAAANVLVEVPTRMTGTPSPRLRYAFRSDEVVVDVDNGRVLWLDNSLLLPVCKELSELDDIVRGVLYWVMAGSELIDSFSQLSGPLTFINPGSTDTYSYIDENGGLQNTSFVDSFIRRHIIEGYYPLQRFEDGLTVQNMLGEKITLSISDDSFLVEGDEVVGFVDYKNGVSLYVDQYLPEQEETLRVSEEKEAILRIFPNPTSELVRLKNCSSSRQWSVSIFSTNGSLMFSKDYTSQEEEVDVSDFQSGLYLIHVRSDEVLDVVRMIVE